MVAYVDRLGRGLRPSFLRSVGFRLVCSTLLSDRNRPEAKRTVKQQPHHREAAVRLDVTLDAFAYEALKFLLTHAQ
jgi:hypothetical protein